MSELITKLNPALVAEAMQAPSIIYTCNSKVQLAEGSYKSHVYDSETSTGVVILYDPYMAYSLFSRSAIVSARLYNINTIESSTFKNCTNLTSVTIGDGVIGIGNSAFYNCSKLASLTIPNSVTSIGYSAFEECRSLKSITIPNSVTSIGQNAFFECGLTSVTIPDSVTSISKGAFSYCDSLTNVTIPDSVSFIGEGAFENCASLVNVTIGRGIIEIGDNAFGNLVSTRIYCKADRAPIGYQGMFITNYSAPTLYVPNEFVEEYKNASGWSFYRDHIVGVVFEDEALKSGKNVKTINGQSILGEGNIDVLSSVNIATSAEIEALFTNTSSSEG